MFNKYLVNSDPLNTSYSYLIYNFNKIDSKINRVLDKLVFNNN